MNKIILRTIAPAALALVLGLYGGVYWGKSQGNCAEPAGRGIAGADAAAGSGPGLLPDPDERSARGHRPPPSTVTVGATADSSGTRVQPARSASPGRPDAAPLPMMAAAEVSGFDRAKLEHTYQQLSSADVNQRHEALRTLAQLGGPEIKPYLIRVAANEAENSEIRRDLIQQIDWSGNTRELGDILVGSRDAEARLAAVGAVGVGNLTVTERMGLEDSMRENLSLEPAEGVKIATLNYFLSADPLTFEQVLQQYPNELSTPEVKSYLEFILTPPDPATPETGASEKSGG